MIMDWIIAIGGSDVDGNILYKFTGTAKEAKKNEPKTEEERREEAIKEANGTEDSEGMLSEILDEQLDTISDDNGTDTLVISGKGMEYCKQLYAAESENQTEEADAENLRLKSMQK